MWMPRNQITLQLDDGVNCWLLEADKYPDLALVATRQLIFAARVSMETLVASDSFSEKRGGEINALSALRFACEADRDDIGVYRLSRRTRDGRTPNSVVYSLSNGIPNFGNNAVGSPG